MSRFLIVNPNTSKEMTSSIRKGIGLICQEKDTFEVINSEIGPASLESFFEYDLSATGTFYTLSRIDLSVYDGILLACFGDPGLYGLKETNTCPVIGIAESSLSIALLLGYKFAILGALQKTIPMMTSMVQQYGLSQRMAGVFALGIPVLDIESKPALVIEKLLKAGKKAVAEGSEVLILGCAGMTGYSDIVEHELNVTVIDPIITGYSVLKSIVECNLKTARNGLYQSPKEKKIVGMEKLV